MTRDQNDTSSARRQVVARPYRHAIGWTTVVWMVVVAAFLCRILLGLPPLVAVSVGDALIIAIASLLISYSATLPSLLGEMAAARRGVAEPSSEGTRQSERQQRQTGLLVAGVMIRLIGTVALFLTCRYQMATPTETVAAMTIGWYVLLTFVDVLVLARELPNAIGGTSVLTPSRSPDTGQGISPRLNEGPDGLSLK